MHYIPVCTRVCEWAHHVGFCGFRKDWCTHRAYTTELNIVACNAHNFLVIWVRCKKVANSTQCDFIHCMHTSSSLLVISSLARDRFYLCSTFSSLTWNCLWLLGLVGNSFRVHLDVWASSIAAAVDTLAAPLFAILHSNRLKIYSHSNKGNQLSA